MSGSEGVIITKDYVHFKVISSENSEIVLWEGTNIRHLFPGDNVQILIDGKLKLVQKYEHKNIVGILLTSSKIKHGIDKRGNTIYVFRPIDMGLPEFVVASSMRNQLTNQWCIVDFLDWLPDTKRPRGAIQTYLGDVGKYENELEAVYKHYRPQTIDWKYWQQFYNKQMNDIIKKYKDNDWQVGRNVCNDYVVSIDPFGCQDIDDALSINVIGEIIRLSIHITDVSCWIDKETPLDTIAQSLGSTLYGYNKNFPIFPRELSEAIFSLIPNQWKPTLTLTIVYSKSQGIILEHSFSKSVICNRNALNYDNYREDNQINWNEIFSLTNILAKKIGLPTIELDDSHKLIEILMIYYNQYVSQLGSGIYRFQPEKLGENYPTELQFLGLESAQYSLEPNNGHYCLGLETYTHATSPIRRYADLLVQRYLQNHSPISTTIIKELNNKQKSSKKFHRDIQFIRAIYENKTRCVDCIILNAKYVYISDWCQKVRFENALKQWSKVALRFYVDPNPIQWKKKIIFQLA